MQLIGTLRDCWRFWSVRFATLQTAVITLWMITPVDIKTIIGPQPFEWTVYGLNALILLSRVIKQQPIEQTELQQMPATQEAPAKEKPLP